MHLAPPAGLSAAEAELAEILRGTRPLTARLSLSPPVEPGPPADLDREELAAFAERWGGALREWPHLLGLLHLLLAEDPQQLGLAIELLDRAHLERPEDAGVLADLAAAHIERSIRSGSSRFAIEALLAADRGSAQKPRHPAALFNRALALEQLHLRSASSAWQDVLAVETDPGWRGEARIRRERLLRPSPADRRLFFRRDLAAVLAGGSCDTCGARARLHPQEVRRFLEDELLPAWGAARLRGERAEAERLLAVGLDVLAGRPPRIAGDLLERSLRSLQGGTDAEIRILAEGFELYGRARRASERQSSAEATPLFEAAAVRLEEGRCPFAFWPRYHLASMTMFRDDSGLTDLLSRFEALRGDLAERDEIARAHLDWMSGFAEQYRGHWGPASHHYRLAEDRFRAAGELENAGAMQALLGEMEREMGRSEEAWSWLAKAIRSRPHLVKSRRIQNLQTALVKQFLAEDRPAGALYFSEEWIVEATAGGNPLSLTLAWASHAQVLGRVGRFEEALEALDRAEAAAEAIPDRALQRVARRIDVAMSRAEIQAASEDLPGALATLDRAVGFVAAQDIGLQRVGLLRRRGEVLADLGDEAAALADLTEAAAEVERQRGLLGQPGPRIAYLDEARGTQEALVSLLAEAGRDEEAFWAADRMRSPELQDALARWTGSALEPQRLASPGGDTAVLAYLSLEDRLLVWFWSPRGLHPWSIPWSREELRRAVARWPGPGSGARDREAGLRLASALLPARWPPEVDRLLVVPDGPLHDVLFAALPLPGSDRVMADRFVLHIPGSLAVAGRQRALAAERPQPNAELLVVAGAETVGEVFPDLADLGDGGTILDLVTRHRPAASLRGEEATPSAFLEAFPRHRQVIFWGHGVLDADSVSEAGLVLSREEGVPSGFLRASKVETLGRESLSLATGVPVSTELVILASCSGAGGVASLSEGSLSLARSFLATGVATVIASRRPVAAEEARALLGELVQLDLSDPAQALARAQRRLRQRSPAAWGASFQSFGSGGRSLVWPDSAPPADGNP